MSCVHLLLGVDILQGLMIREGNKFLRQKVMSPIAKCLDHRVEFLVVGGVSLSGIIQLLNEVSNWITFLSEALPIPIPDASHATSKILEKLGRRIDRSTHHSLLDIHKGSCDSARLSEFTLLQTVGAWGYGSAKPFDKLTIESSESVKTSYITVVFGLGHCSMAMTFSGPQKPHQ